MPDVNPQELHTSSEAIARPPIRQVFAKNPLAALEQAGVKVQVTVTACAGNADPAC